MRNTSWGTGQAEEAQARSGLIAPVPDQVPMGSNLYRFASTASQSLDLRASPWWIREVDFELIHQRAVRAGIDLSQRARWDLAVLPAWGNRMDVALRAKVTRPIWAWGGLAKPQNERTPHGSIVRRFGLASIRQLYLIGIVDPNVRVGNGILLTQLGRDSLVLTGAKPIPAVSR